MKTLLAAILLLGSLILHAGDKVGNGGDVIVCPDQKTLLLDIYQGEASWDFTPILRLGNRSDIIKETIKSFSKVDPFIGVKFLKRALEINSEITRIEENAHYRSSLVKMTSQSLVNISDEGVAEIPFNCTILQAATQLEMPFPGEVKFTFQKELWGTLEKDVQASLILHEVIYEHMIAVGEKFSRSTRYFNAALYADELNSVKKYFDTSSLFEFRNLAIPADGVIRSFGECKIKRERFRPGNFGQLEGTTITVYGRNVVTKKENFFEAIVFFWKEVATEDFCD